MANGLLPSFERLAGWEFKGLNTMAAADLIGIRKFKKGFYRGEPRTASGPEPFIQGYNVKVKQSGDRLTHTPVVRDGEPVRHGFFRVYNATQLPAARYPKSLVLDYGLGDNGWSPSGLLVDYLVQVYPDNSDLLLGFASFRCKNPFRSWPWGTWRIPAGYFVLQREQPHSFGTH